MKKSISILFTLVLLFLSKNIYADGEKVIIILMDELNIETIQDVQSDNNIALGLMNIKVKEYLKEESMYKRLDIILQGRRVRKSVEIPREIKSLGEILKKEGKSIGLIGEEDRLNKLSDVVSPLSYKRSIEAKDKENLNQLVNEFFTNNGNLLLINLKDMNSKSINEVIKRNTEKSIFILPISTIDNQKEKLNYTVVPILYYKDNNEGLLFSQTTKRKGIVSNLDIYPTILSLYDIKQENIGNSINILEHKEPLKYIKKELNNITDINLLKYLFHGILIFLQILFFIIYIIYKKTTRLSTFIGYLILSIFFSSFLLTPLMNILNIYTYLIGIFLIVVFIMIKARKNTKVPIYMTIFINLFILLGVYFKNELLYNSYIGYNNIFAGGRYYGINNEAMGVLLATSIIVFYNIQEKIFDKYSKGISIIYLLIIILSFTGIYGANVGGFITSIFMSYILIKNLFYKNVKVNIWLIIFLIILAISINLLIDRSLGNKSHLSNLSLNIKQFGINELINIVKNKLEQVAFFATTFPWSIIWVLNFIFSSIILHRDKDIHLKIIYFTSLFALFINDTGIIAFIYMNTFFMLIYLKIINIQNN
ncbi:hypothetical protein GOQ27_11570 [Clostridium sp. D2Q-11]|uniref:Uncharacterized protein n=1 Tax=Anaeromonas frigoriresistens TaxID=2683708 RepID=A0A942Z9R4_9FIRM|nr:hypothetical protein [Anaeromonas frigoriresistens]MBS4539105.1 hypothetical protein [Anaeromonas frigoriresistens]